VPLLVKIAPDLSDDDVLAVADLALATRLDGVIATNTTISRDGLATPTSRVEEIGAGGLSGRPLTQRSEDVVRLLRERVGPDLTLVGVGGITTVDDARRRLAAGADLLQGYTAFVYEGPLWPHRIVKGIVRGLATDG
jgi:dihydroorotate dehydrogenase